MRSLHRFTTCRFGILLLVGGCGVSDYESKMIDAQNREKRAEEEAALLDAPIKVPERMNKDEQKVPIATLFLRPPRGIDTSPANEDAPRLNLLYRYLPRPGGANGVVLVELAFGNQKEFRNEVIRCYNATDKPTTHQRQVKAPNREVPTTFETIEFEDGQYFYSVNFWFSGQNQIAIVYGMNKNQRSALTKAVELSLESFAVDRDVPRQRELLNKGSPLQSVPGHPGF